MADGYVVRGPRRFTLEVWYPATLAAGQVAGTVYRVTTRDPSVSGTLAGRAVRDAAPAPTERFPLVIVSHGYPGNRFLLAHLGEQLASRGYVVVAIDHPESMYEDQQTFASTLYHRPTDQLFVLEEIARQAAPGSGSVLSGHVDVEHAGLVGYSMGGYGVLNAVGAGFTDAATRLPSAPPLGLLRERAASSDAYRQSRDPRIRAAIAIAPWGMQTGFWDGDGLSAVTTPLLFIAGSADTVAGYETGTRAAYRAASNSDRWLLTFANASHNAGAPVPAPAETYVATPGRTPGFLHYADPVWDSVRMNNIVDHFAVAWFDRYLKGDGEKSAFLAEGGGTRDLHGFLPHTSTGLTLEHLSPQP